MDHLDLLHDVISTLKNRPVNLARRLRANASAEEVELSPEQVDALLDRALTGDANDPTRLLMIEAFQRLDGQEGGDQFEATAAYSPERRALIHRLLGWGDRRAAAWDDILLVPRVQQPTVIAVDHERWYTSKARTRSFYWTKYREHLVGHGWEPASLEQLDVDSSAIVGNLSDPEREQAFASRGLVVGYVQSGKTANFTAVIAKAIDAGYRLIIVLAGMHNILREQTQRRIDKELIGWEVCGRDGAGYVPGDEGEFVHHGPAAPIGWERLTDVVGDYKALGRGVSAMRFERANPKLPLHHPENLHACRARVVVVKKNGTILTKLARDLKVFSNDLAEVPALVIDDESDQASVNTAKEGKEATAVNRCIRDILGLLPRGQYVGYTATPFANVFINPDDPKDLFPKDFIVSLQRPRNYVGLREFFGIAVPDEGYDEDVEAIVHAQRTAPLVLPIPEDKDDATLREAVDTFVLAGAIKLYRASQTASNPPASRYTFRHHTMLVHRSARQADHVGDRDLVSLTWDESAWHSPKTRERLRKLWTSMCAISKVRGPELPMPASFDDLWPFVGDAVDRINGGRDGAVWIVNGNDEDATTPDFEKEKVWKILVGGNKLSRGYTVEGLTVSFFGRAAVTADTLMQMGRWFGFRRGYQDLVRLYAAASARSGRKSRDLMEDFLEICWLEEEVRLDLRRYQKADPPIRPKDVRPLVRKVGEILPTARPKMRNTEIIGRNWSNGRSTPTMAPTSSTDIQVNQELLKKLLSTMVPEVHALDVQVPTGSGLRRSRDTLVHAVAGRDAVAAFLRGFRWSSAGSFAEVLSFLGRDASETRIDRWHILSFVKPKAAPPGFATPWSAPAELSVIERSRAVTGLRFNVYGEPDERRIAEGIVGHADPVPGVPVGQDVRSGVMVVYAVREKGAGAGAMVNVGFELFFPGNEMANRLFFRAGRGGGLDGSDSGASST